MRFPPNFKQYYINIKPNNLTQEFYIFVKLYANTKINSKNFDIYFLMIINENYPGIAPIVLCLTDVK